MILRTRWKKWWLHLLLGLGFIAWFVEYALYYVVQSQCDWPSIERSGDKEPVKAMILSDPHLLGPIKGHWFDKLRREWQMHQAFQTALRLHTPEVVFILGDILDEGDLVTNKEYTGYAARFYRIFKVPEEIKVYVVAGNHDVGFHYKSSRVYNERFNKELNTSSVEIISIRDNHFVLINSVAMEGDGCYLCSEAVKRIAQISNMLKCAETPNQCLDVKILPGKYSRPIIMQHFPIYRESEDVCHEDDSLTQDRRKPHKQRWDVLSLKSTNEIVKSLKPRVAFDGHTHYGCRLDHDIAGVKFEEFTIASFSWRNLEQPSYMLVLFTPDAYAVSKCKMVTELTIIATAFALLVTLAIIMKKRSRYF